MTRPNMCAAVLVLCCAPTLPAMAHETGIYESLEHIHIGRVFLTPAERAHLDKNRNVRAPRAGVSSNPASDKGDARNERAAGYIVSGSGRTRVWREGDFVAADSPSSMRFPGDVKVTRAADKEPDATDLADSDFESSTAGAADNAD